jgi:protease II
VPTSDPLATPQLVRPRVHGTEYFVEHTRARGLVLMVNGPEHPNFHVLVGALASDHGSVGSNGGGGVGNGVVTCWEDLPFS